MDETIIAYLLEKSDNLASDGYSLYEVANMLNAHPAMLNRIIEKKETRAKFILNNYNFILKINAGNPSPLRTDYELRKHNLVIGANGTIVFTGRLPKTLSAWEKKIPLLVKTELEEWQKAKPVAQNPGQNQKEDTASLTEDNLRSDSGENYPALIPVNRHETDAGVAEKIMNEYLDGISLKKLAVKYNVDHFFLDNLLKSNNLPEKITQKMVIKRIRDAFKSGVSLNELQLRFPAKSPRQIEVMIKMPVKRLRKLKNVIHAAEEQSENLQPAAPVKKIKITREIAALIIGDYKDGMAPDKISKKYKVELRIVLGLLKASGNYKSYYEKNIFDEKIRNAAIVDYYKKGWCLTDLKEDFRLGSKQIKNILIEKGFIMKDSPPGLTGKRSKMDLIINYHKKGKSIADIAGLLVLTPERVEFLLRKKGLLTE